MKIMFSCIHFPVWPYPPQNNDFFKFYTGKLYGLTGTAHMSENCFHFYVLYTDDQ